MCLFELKPGFHWMASIDFVALHCFGRAGPFLGPRPIGFMLPIQTLHVVTPVSMFPMLTYGSSFLYIYQGWTGWMLRPFTQL